MRIISGIAKGKKILDPDDKKTRPLKDIVRESIFNILHHSNLLNINFNECILLDIFSGSGSFGLEAISRGFQKVVFFENYKNAIELLEKNLKILGFKDKAEIIKKNAYETSAYENTKLKFNIVFIDPPFKDKSVNILLENLLKTRIINRETLIIIHRKKTVNESYIEQFKLLRNEVYGSSKIIFGFIDC